MNRPAKIDELDLEGLDNSYDRKSNESYRARQSQPKRQQRRGAKKSANGAPGGIRQRRNKHWSW